MWIFFKGKGIFITAYFTVTAILFMAIYHIFKPFFIILDSCFENPSIFYGGIFLIINGVPAYFTGFDTIEKEGKKIKVINNSSFMFADLCSVGKAMIYWGSFILICSILMLIFNLTRQAP